MGDILGACIALCEMWLDFNRVVVVAMTGVLELAVAELVEDVVIVEAVETQEIAPILTLAYKRGCTGMENLLTFFMFL